MPKEISKTDIDFFYNWIKSPLKFVEDVWDKIPQPAKPEYQNKVNDLLDSGKFEEITADMFGDYKLVEINDYLDPDDRKDIYYGIQIKEWSWYNFNIKNHLTWQQTIFLKAIELIAQGKVNKKRISVVSGHGTGKSCDLSFALFWFITTHIDSQIPCTAPTSGQMFDVLWKELRKWHRQMPDWIKNNYIITNDYVRITERPKEWFARARTASIDNPEALSGIHSETGVMLIVDEASGVCEAVFDNAEGSLTNEDVYVLFTSNGVRAEGYFFNSQNKLSSNFITLCFNSEESPIVNRKFIVDWLIKCNGDREDDRFRVRVRGLFPKDESMDDKGYVPLVLDDWIDWIDDNANYKIDKLGIDPAGGGKDKTAWSGRNSIVGKCLATEKTSNDKSIALKTSTLKSQYEIQNENIFVDNFGIGSNVPVEIMKLNDGDNTAVEGVNVQWTGTRLKELVEDEIITQEEFERFENLKAILCWRARMWLKQGGQLVKDNEFKEEILAVKFKTKRNGKIMIMPKEELLRRGIKSPNKFEAFMLTFLKPDTVKKNEPKNEVNIANVLSRYRVNSDSTGFRS